MKDTFGPYRIGPILGSGAMGTVFRATHMPLGREVALKVCGRAADEETDDFRRFRREMRLVSTLHHPHLVVVFDGGTISNTPYIAMELLHGETLQQLLDKTGRLEVAHALLIGSQLADGLACLHELGIIHRDIKPGNVMLPDGGVKIVDFGLSRSMTGTVMTQSGAMIGTPLYMAPEVAKGITAGPQADLWSAGVVLYQLLTGVDHILEESVSNLLAQLAKNDLKIEPVDRVRPEIPAAVSSLVGRLLVADPAHRIDSAARLRDEIQALMAGLERRNRVPSRDRSSRSDARAKRPTPKESRTLFPWLTFAGTRNRTALGVGVGLVAMACGWGLTLDPINPAVTVQNGDEVIVAFNSRRPYRGMLSCTNESNSATTVSTSDLASDTAHLLKIHLPEKGRYSLTVSPGALHSSWRKRVDVPGFFQVRPERGASDHHSLVRVPAIGERAQLRLPSASGTLFAEARERFADDFNIRVPLSMADIQSGAAVEMNRGGVKYLYVVDTLQDLTDRLISALNHTDIAIAVAQLVHDRRYNPHLGIAHEASHIMMPDFCLDGGDDPRKSQDGVQPGLFRGLVKEYLERIHLWGDLELFRLRARDYFRCPSVPVEKKLYLYDQLLKLGYLDQVIHSQRDVDDLKIDDLLAGFIQIQAELRTDRYFRNNPTYSTIAPVEDQPVSVQLSKAGYFGYVTADYETYRALTTWYNDCELPLAYLHRPRPAQPATIADLKRDFPPQRMYSVDHGIGPRRNATACLEGWVGFLAPAYYFDVQIVGPAARGITLRLAPRGAVPWLQAMDHFAQPEEKVIGQTPESSSDADPAVVYRWGLIRIRFPANILPAGPFQVIVDYRHLPGAPISNFGIERPAFLSGLRLFIEPNEGRL